MAAKDLAEHLGISASHLSRFENGKLKHLDKAKDQLIRVIVAASHAAPSRSILAMITGTAEPRHEPGVFENNAQKWSVAA
jgi:transcriptional regulator with XRE-family HTH domain